jgi:hypothetical protein
MLQPQLPEEMELHLEWAVAVGDQHKPPQKLVTAVTVVLLAAEVEVEVTAQVFYLVMVAQVVTDMWRSLHGK